MNIQRFFLGVILSTPDTTKGYPSYKISTSKANSHKFSHLYLSLFIFSFIFISCSHSPFKAQSDLQTPATLSEELLQAHLLLENKKTEEALKSFKAIEKSYLNTPFSNYGKLGQYQCYQESSQLKLAAQGYLDLLQTDSSLLPDLRVQTRLLLAETYIQMGQVHSALGTLDEIENLKFALTPYDQIIFHARKGLLYLTIGQVDLSNEQKKQAQLLLKAQKQGPLSNQDLAKIYFESSKTWVTQTDHKSFEELIKKVDYFFHWRQEAIYLEDPQWSKKSLELTQSELTYVWNEAQKATLPQKLAPQIYNSKKKAIIYKQMTILLDFFNAHDLSPELEKLDPSVSHILTSQWSALSKKFKLQIQNMIQSQNEVIQKQPDKEINNSPEELNKILTPDNSAPNP